MKEEKHSSFHLQMPHTIREWPIAERPRERLVAKAPAALASRELLAILIETGLPASGERPARSALDIAVDLLRHFATQPGGPSLRKIMTGTVAELSCVQGIGPAKATKILAALELGRRAIDEERAETTRIRSAVDVHALMRLTMRDLRHEEFHVVLLTTQNEVIRTLQITRGTLDASLVHPREVFRPAIVESAASVILVHNHPSGDPSPSAEDRAVTRQLRGAGELVGIEVLDHVIIGDRWYTSFAESGLLE